MRVWISLDVNKPLKWRMKVKKASEEWLWIHFKYERLPTFCYFCRVLGHSENFCEKAFNAHNPIEDYMYGAWLHM